MKKRKMSAILLAGTLAAGCLAGPAYGKDRKFDIILETTPDISTLNGQVLSLEAESTASSDNHEDMFHFAVSIEEDMVEIGAESFEQKLQYQTFRKEDSPKLYLPNEVVIHGEVYVLSDTGTPLVISREERMPKRLSYESEVFIGDGAEYEPDASITGEDGKSYHLVFKERKEQTAQERTEYKETSVTYSAVEAGVEIPDQKMLEFEDMDTKQTVTAALDLKSKETIREYWSDDFVFNITVTGYDADVFTLNGVEVPKGANLTDYADEFLKYLRLDESFYQIEEISWDGESYERDGYLVRNAIGTGRKYVQDIRAAYDGQVTLPAIVGNTWIGTYEEEIPAEEQMLITMAVQATYTRKAVVAEAAKPMNQKVLNKLFGVITAAYRAVVAAFMEHPVMSSVLLVVLAAFLTFFISRKKRNICIYDPLIRCSYKKRNKEKCKMCVNYRKRQQV